MRYLLFVYVADDPKKTEHLLTLDGAKERLSLFEANLMVDGSFESAVNGCECIFHTASPVLLSVTDPQASFRFWCFSLCYNDIKHILSLNWVFYDSALGTIVRSCGEGDT